MTAQPTTSKKVLGVLAFKILALSLYLMLENNVIEIGEKATFAEDQKSQKTTQATTTKTDISNQFLAQLSNEEIRNHELMKDLLDMPDIKTDDLKKENIDAYINMLNKKNEIVQERLQLLANKIATYESLEKNLQEKIGKIKEETEFFTQTLQREKKVKKERLDKLIKLYEKMEPKRAAPVFENMDKDLVVSLFKEIRQKQITAILENMNPDKATELTEYYGRIRSTSEYEILKEMNKSLKDAFAECKAEE